MCNFGNGFTFSEVYSMPVYLRKFYYQQLADAKQQEQDQMKKAQASIKRPNIKK